MEGISTHRYKQWHGVAGINQIKSRALLEAAGIDSGSFARGLAPNLEALKLDLPKYQRGYLSFFQISPYQRAM